ncbi:Receptor-like serine/threonine-protein kinase [Actinidia chinensis var. chinensis]|uniref:Receptor-like serine/threonine-protein kinase n=1 Tax=Actinidia chinensis var. chinensis TaxID=1590841 RepID=A0A2R6RBJ9_ACTCC|nr:Receptor-like serine/threonine-protein kinase [Actinidia chinensis var. chinensis]
MATNTTATPARPPLHHITHNHQLHPQPHKHHHDIFPSASTLIIIVPIIIVFILCSILLIVLMLRRLKSAKRSGSSKSDSGASSNSNCMFIAHSTININASPDVKGGCLYGGTSARIPLAKLRGVQVFTYKELEVATNSFSEANVIGNGAFGVVYYRGLLRDGTVAAIKKLHREGRQGERAFRVEVDLLSRLHCPYLVELLGYCADQHHRLLIFECMPNGTLHHQLHLHHQHPSRHQPPPLNWGTRLCIALDCARALEFLHEHALPSVIHRNFKSGNILLDQNFRAKVWDFGLAKTDSDKINGQISTRVLGTTGYLAPEYASTGKLTTKSDVYSYGVVLLELLTGRVPVDTKRPPRERVLVSWALPRLTNREKMVEMVDPLLQGQYSKKDLIQVAAIAAMCVQAEADYRPLMTDVVQSLIPLVKNMSSTCPSNSLRFSRTVSPKS